MDSCVSKEHPQQEVSFVSLGMVLLDELHVPGKSPIFDVIGGSGGYGTLGARLFAGATKSKTIGCLVLAGKDFPTATEAELRGWGMTLLLRRDSTKLSTRGLLEYEDTTFGPKKFRYLTDPLKPSPADLQSTPLLGAKAFHLLATPEEITRQIPELMSLRRQYGVEQRPLIIWEPFPAACQPSNRGSFLAACSLVDVFSPNHIEVTGLFTDEKPKLFHCEQLEFYAQTFLEASVGPSGQGCVVIRAAEHGCLTASRSERFTWLPAYYALNAAEVIDPTGGGNAFLGGLAIGLQETASFAEAASYGSVAASFALEQIGLPSRNQLGDGETWNETIVLSRLEEYKSRLDENIIDRGR
ncbi:pfkB family kinase [Glonium stellatum]|uniref:PfkB family kinase n=1 Tax=Glonium stellatum TaxID=574774 RepID=A0A8E2JY16_9PEZI|nr:pfkB family kinase [Glonium stellatum]